MSIPGPSSSHRRGTNARTRENQLPRTFLRARGGLGDAPTTSATEDDVQPRRERKKRNRSTLNNTPTPTPGPGGNSEMDVGKPLPRPPSKLNRIVTPRAEAASQAPLLNVRPPKSSSKLHKRPQQHVTFVAETDEEGYDSQSTLGRQSSAVASELSKLQTQVLELKKVCFLLSS